MVEGGVFDKMCKRYSNSLSGYVRRVCGGGLTKSESRRERRRTTELSVGQTVGGTTEEQRRRGSVAEKERIIHCYGVEDGGR